MALGFVIKTIELSYCVGSGVAEEIIDWLTYIER
jgi:hypothetical protein